MGEFDALLVAARQGDRESVDKLLALTYEELRELAHSRLRRSGKITVLDTTALVHECYLRISALEKLDAESQAHFFGYAAHVMRSIVVDIVRVHEALEELSLIDERLVRVVEMRYFAGLTEAQIAKSLGVTERTVRRDWQKARLLLHVALR